MYENYNIFAFKQLIINILIKKYYLILIDFN